MKFEWVPNSFGRSLIVASPEVGDATPRTSAFIIDHVIDSFSDDRFMAAAALVFGDETRSRFWTAGSVSKRAAFAVERLRPTVPARVDRVNYGQTPQYSGETIIEVFDHLSSSKPTNRLGEERRFYLDVLRTDEYAGGLRTMDRVTVASNAWLHSKRDSGVVYWYPFIAAAILLADSMAAGAIRLPASAYADRVDDDIVSVTALCDSVGLQLI